MIEEGIDDRAELGPEIPPQPGSARMPVQVAN